MQKQESQKDKNGKERRLTASIFATVLGIGFDSRQKLWRQMTGREERFQGNVMTEWGNDHEMDAVHQYEIVTGKLVTACGDDQESIVHPDLLWLSCTPDGYADEAVIEVKCPYKMELYPDVPAHYMAQIQGQMMITGYDTCHFSCWTPDDFACWEVRSSDEYQQTMIDKLAEFYYSYLIPDEEPKRSKKAALPTITTERIY